MIYLPSILLYLAGACSGIMDILQFHFDDSMFNGLNNTFWNPFQSWRNKWKNGNPEEGEKYWGSSRWFVRFTDGWHTIKHFMIVFIVVGVLIAMLSNEVNYIAIGCMIPAWWLGFWSTYENKLINNQ